MTVPGSRSGRGWLVACDLDQTLIYSRRSVPPDPPPTVVAERLDGAPQSFLTARAGAGLARLAAAATLVPVTTRTVAQYARVDLGVRCRYGIAANGGHLLVDGVPDPAWARSVAGRLAGCRPLAQVRAYAEGFADPSWLRTLRDADGLFVYLVAHDRALIPDLTAAADRLAADGWVLSVQGRKVYLVPAALTKEAAVAELERRLGGPRLAAAGDAVLDRGLLERADVAVRPAHGELHEQGWTRPGLRITDRAGLLGGEDVVHLLADGTAEVR